MSQLERRRKASQPVRRGTVSSIARIAGEAERNAEVLVQDLAVRLRVAERRAEAEILQYKMDQRNKKWAE